MSHQLPTDCLIKIFEILEDNKTTLYSCLLVNRHWCKISVVILWRNVWNFERSSDNRLRIPSVDAAILSTLVTCLPSESKELLNKNEISISTPTSKPPLFNYAAFCKVLSIYKICETIDHIVWEGRINKNNLVAKEILKMFMNQISSLKSLTYYPNYLRFDPSNIINIFYLLSRSKS